MANFLDLLPDWLAKYLKRFFNLLPNSSRSGRAIAPDPIDGSQIVFSAVFLLGAAILFGMTIDALRVGINYGYFPVSIPFDRYYSLDQGDPLNVDSGIRY
jgi:hypothetical protein